MDNETNEPLVPIVDLPYYGTWRGMCRRCFDKNHKTYKYYGERGITVCDEWKNDCRKFHSDMGEKPDPSFTLDRIDTNGNYEPSNCRWASRSDQMWNTSRTRYAEINGVVKPLHVWAEEAGLQWSIVYQRVYLLGQTPTEALSKPHRRTRKTKEKLTLQEKVFGDTKQCYFDKLPPAEKTETESKTISAGTKETKKTEGGQS